jgi:WD40 repeat protein
METVMFRNFDAKFDLFNTELEKHISRLPENLRFIKKLIHHELIPKVFNVISELEKLKTTSSYDENLLKLKPHCIVKAGQISCIDMFENNNIKHFNRSTKLVYGTYIGTIAIFDFEQQRVVVEKTLPMAARVEVIATATIKYFDTYLSRIAVSVRGDTNIYVYTYNHSYTIANLETTIILTNEKVISLSNLISHMKFSKDGFFLSLTDYTGGVRMYKFNDIPQIDAPMDKSSNNLHFNKSAGLVGKPAQTEQGGNSICTPIFQTKYTEPENFTIIKLEKPPEDPKAAKGKQNEVKMKSDKSMKPDKAADKLSSTKGLKDKEQIVVPDEINIPPYYEDKIDLTPLRRFNEHLPLITFIQKKIIFEDKTGGFCSSLITVGLYIGYYGTNCLKFHSLFSYLTDNMKSVFKVTKIKGGSSLLSQDEAMSMSNVNKKEKEYISFLKSKLDGPPQQAETTSKDFKTSSKKISSSKDLGLVKDKQKEPEIKKDVNLSEYTRKEINFGLLHPITALVGQKTFSNTNNLLAIGLKDGSVIVWDAELHSDRFLFQEKRDEITSLTIDEDYLTCGSLDGQLHIYNLKDGSLVFTTIHNPYINNPIQSVKIY